MIKMIWAQTKNGVIGKGNSLPWSIPKEMKHFRETTNQKTVLMGSITFDSLNHQPLKNRQNYVLTKNIAKYKDIKFPNLTFCDKTEDIVAKFQGSKTEDVYIIGGNCIFNHFFPYADEIIRTIIYQEHDGDVKITEFDFSNFKLKKTVQEDEFEIQYFERKKRDD